MITYRCLVRQVDIRRAHYRESVVSFEAKAVICVIETRPWAENKDPLCNVFLEGGITITDVFVSHDELMGRIEKEMARGTEHPG